MSKPENGKTLIFRVAVPLPVERLFDYFARKPEATETVAPGARILVPFGKSRITAYLVDILEQSDRDPETLKTIIAILDNPALLRSQDVQLLHWASRYYHHPLGEVFSAAFPALLRKGGSAELKLEKIYRLTARGRQTDTQDLARAPRQAALLQQLQHLNHGASSAYLSGWSKNWRQPAKALLEKGLLEIVESPKTDALPPENTATCKAGLQANPQQQIAIDSVCRGLHKFSVFLLEGVTGSGKTEVYMQIIRRVLQQGRQVLILLPEITLTPQLEARFRERFSVPVVVFHSALTDRQRQTAWMAMQQGRASILLGTRSALFTPMQAPGLIVVDEEHDSSFKQQQGFRYSARDVAVVRGKILQIPVVMGSATPSLESLYNVSRKRYTLLHLAERAGGAAQPDLQILDIRNKKLHDGIADALLREIRLTLADGRQVLIFLNRRGFAPTLICHACGWVAKCRRCDASLVVHFSEQRLRCHHCGHEQRLPNSCPSCTEGQLTPLGQGTERLENTLTQLFPEQKIVRMDRDTTQRKGSLEKHLDAIQQGTANIILGTQMLAKGHHFPNVTLVALLDVDSGLFSIDYHAPEKLAQLIVQVSGRAGRAESKGRVILQTRQPEHPLLVTLLQHGYRRFAEIALQERQAAGLPPYSHQALLRALAVDQKKPLEFLERVRAMLEEKKNTSTEIMGPASAPMARRAGRYRCQLLLQNASRQELHDLLDWLMPKIAGLKQARNVRWSLDVDPLDLY